MWDKMLEILDPWAAMKSAPKGEENMETGKKIRRSVYEHSVEFVNYSLGICGIVAVVLYATELCLRYL